MIFSTNECKIIYDHEDRPQHASELYLRLLKFLLIFEFLADFQPIERIFDKFSAAHFIKCHTKLFLEALMSPQSCWWFMCAISSKEVRKWHENLWMNFGAFRFDESMWSDNCFRCYSLAASCNYTFEATFFEESENVNFWFAALNKKLNSK